MALGDRWIEAAPRVAQDRRDSFEDTHLICGARPATHQDQPRRRSAQADPVRQAFAYALVNRILHAAPSRVGIGAFCADAHATVQGWRLEFASRTTSAVMLMMRRTVAEGVRMCTGLAAPSRIGPIATLFPAAVLSR